MVVFVQVLGEIEELSKRLENAPPPPTVSFIEPPSTGSQPSAVAASVKAVYQKMKSSTPAVAEIHSSRGGETKASNADEPIEQSS